MNIPKQEDYTPLVLFDGICNLCNHSIQAIIKCDPQGKFHFANLESDVGRKYLDQKKSDGLIDSIVLIYNQKIYVKSEAVLEIAGILGGPLRVLTFLRIFPVSWQNIFYDIVARNRYRWFGKRDTCMIPVPELQNRFVD